MPFENIVFLALQETLAELNERHNAKLYHRNLRDMSDPFFMPRKHFINDFRLSKEVTKMLIESLRSYMPERQRSTGIPIELKVLMALSFFGHGSYQRCVGNHLQHAADQSCVSRIVGEVTEVMVERMLPQWVVFPQTNTGRSMIKEGFQTKHNFPGVIGAVDCTHVAIIAPKFDDPIRPGVSYYNRKAFYSLNVQTICDSDLKILNCNAKFPGSVHDSAIWSLSSVKNHLQQLYLTGELGSSWLIGDAGYALQPWLLTPVGDAAEGTPEGRYNRAHIAARNCIERCFGVLKQRFRCLLKHRALHYNPVKAAKIVLTCTVLHNMAIQYRLPMPDDFSGAYVDPIVIDGPPDNSDNHEINWLSAGRRVQNTIIRNNFS